MNLEESIKNNDKKLKNLQDSLKGQQTLVDDLNKAISNEEKDKEAKLKTADPVYGMNFKNPEDARFRAGLAAKVAEEARADAARLNAEDARLQQKLIDNKKIEDAIYKSGIAAGLTPQAARGSADNVSLDTRQRLDALHNRGGAGIGTGVFGNPKDYGYGTSVEEADEKAKKTLKIKQDTETTATTVAKVFADAAKSQQENEARLTAANNTMREMEKSLADQTTLTQFENENLRQQLMLTIQIAQTRAASNIAEKRQQDIKERNDQLDRDSTANPGHRTINDISKNSNIAQEKIQASFDKLISAYSLWSKVPKGLDASSFVASLNQAIIDYKAVITAMANNPNLRGLQFPIVPPEIVKPKPTDNKFTPAGESPSPTSGLPFDPEVDIPAPTEAAPKPVPKQQKHYEWMDTGDLPDHGKSYDEQIELERERKRRHQEESGGHADAVISSGNKTANGVDALGKTMVAALTDVHSEVVSVKSDIESIRKEFNTKLRRIHNDSLDS